MLCDIKVNHVMLSMSMVMVVTIINILLLCIHVVIIITYCTGILMIVTTITIHIIKYYYTNYFELGSSVKKHAV